MSEKLERRFSDVSKSQTFRNIVSTFSLDRKRVLDIGRSYGEFLSHFGPGSVGLSIEPEEVKYGVHRGLDIRLGNIEEDEILSGERFDVIFANNIFEHLYSPHAFLVKVKHYLKPGGLLILGVPCIPLVPLLTRVGKFRGAFASGHINFFTRTTLLHTVLRAGWSVSSIRGFHFMNRFIDHLFDLIYPHLYVEAYPDPDFRYPEKRLRELAGYAVRKE